jgi:hypothetical protein
MLAGPIDFTPGIFNLKLKKLKGDVGMSETREKIFDLESYKPDNQVSTTLAKQLALYVVLYSPVQMAADLPQHYQGHEALQFIKDVAVDWEQSKVLDGEIGEYVVITRQERGSETWFLGAITNEKARNYNLHFDFLDPGSSYEVTAYLDAENAHWDDNPQAYKIKTFEVNHETRIDLKMAAGGGFALTIKKLD